MRSRSRIHGFTLLEAAISSALLGVALLTGVLVSRSAMDATARSIGEGSTETRILRGLENVTDRLAAAGASTLEAVPTSTDGADRSAEPMLDGLAYDNVWFRCPVTWVDGVRIYEPDVLLEPYRIELAPGEKGRCGSLVLYAGEDAVELCTNVTAATFVRDGDLVAVAVALLDADGSERKLQSSVALHAR
jgi:hypothetical protein